IGKGRGGGESGEGVGALTVKKKTASLGREWKCCWGWKERERKVRGVRARKWDGSVGRNKIRQEREGDIRVRTYVSTSVVVNVVICVSLVPHRHLSVAQPFI